MSFPKAKIHRFNEDISCAPPPGTYDPKLDTKAKGTPNKNVNRRFPDQRCISSSLDSLNKCINTKATFQTPQSIRKVGLTPRLRSIHDKNIHTQGSLASTCSVPVTDGKIFKTPISSSDYQRLKHQWTTLKEKQEAEINSLKTENLRLQQTLKEAENREASIKLLLEEKIALASRVQHEMFEAKQNLDNIEEIVIRESEDHVNYVKALEFELSLNKNERKHLERIVTKQESTIATINDKFLNFKNGFKFFQEKTEEEIEFIEEQNSKQVDKFLLESENKVQQLEESVKTKLYRLEEEFNVAQENALTEFQEKLETLLNNEFEPKFCKINNLIKTCYSRIDELRKLVNQNEKTHLKSIEEVDERCRLIYRELCKVECQRDELIAADLERNLTVLEIQTKSDRCEEDLKTYIEKCKKYEITLRAMHETVNALSDRLLESENEIARLISGKFILEPKTKGSDEYLPSSCNCVTQKIKEMDEGNLDNFKLEVEKNLQILKDKSQLDQSTIVKLQNQLSYVNVLVNELKYLKISNESKICALKTKVADDKTRFINAERELQLLKNENNRQLYVNNCLKDQMKSLEEIVEKKTRNEVKLQQCIDGLFSDLVSEKKTLESLGMEKKNLERELALSETNCNKKEQEIKELNLKLESMDRSLRNLEEKVCLTEEDKGILEIQLLDAENNSLTLKSTNELLSKSNAELRNKISELQHSLTLAKEKIKNEIPNLERDNINKAACILELSLTIDTLTETVGTLENNISYLQADNNSLTLQLSEAKSQLSDLEYACDDKNNIISMLSECIPLENSSVITENELAFDDFGNHGETAHGCADNDLGLQETVLHASNMELKCSANKDNHNESSDNEESQLTGDLSYKKAPVIISQENDFQMSECHENESIENFNILKKPCIEFREEPAYLEKENTRPSKNLAETKENAKTAGHESGLKVLNSNFIKPSSPAVLREKNCQ